MVLLHEPLLDERGCVGLVQEHENVGTQFLVLDTVAGRPLHDVADVRQTHFVEEQVDGQGHGLCLAARCGDFDRVRQSVEIQHQPLGGGVAVCAASS